MLSSFSFLFELLILLLLWRKPSKINASFDYANASDIEITIRGYSNKLLTNWTVNLTLTKGSVSQILEKTTDENGVVILSEAELNPLEAGNWTLNITIAGDDNYYDITTEVEDF